MYSNHKNLLCLFLIHVTSHASSWPDREMWECSTFTIYCIFYKGSSGLICNISVKTFSMFYQNHQTSIWCDVCLQSECPAQNLFKKEAQIIRSAIEIHTSNNATQPSLYHWYYSLVPLRLILSENTAVLSAWVSLSHHYHLMKRHTRKDRIQRCYATHTYAHLPLYLSFRKPRITRNGNQMHTAAHTQTPLLWAAQIKTKVRLKI